MIKNYLMNPAELFVRVAYQHGDNRPAMETTTNYYKLNDYATFGDLFATVCQDLHHREGILPSRLVVLTQWGDVKGLGLDPHRLPPTVGLREFFNTWKRSNALGNPFAWGLACAYITAHGWDAFAELVQKQGEEFDSGLTLWDDWEQVGREFLDCASLDFLERYGLEDFFDFEGWAMSNFAHGQEFKEVSIPELEIYGEILEAI